MLQRVSNQNSLEQFTPERFKFVLFAGLFLFLEIFHPLPIELENTFAVFLEYQETQYIGNALLEPLDNLGMLKSVLLADVSNLFLDEGGSFGEFRVLVYVDAAVLILYELSVLN